MSPFLLEPRFIERIWGVDSLGPWFPPMPEGKRVGEVWLTAEDCNIVGTPATLGSLAQRYPTALGDAHRTGFPLLIKLLYPREKLSVQVHPNDEQAQSLLQQPRGKTECWFVLSAEPDAQVAVGLREPMSNEQIERHIAAGTIEQTLRMLPVRAGDMIFVDAGTVHAIGPGMVILETQQYSDVTYRLWDYGRPRELHIQQGLAVVRTHTRAGLVPSVSMQGFDRLVACEYFAVDRLRISQATSAPLGYTGHLQVVIALEGECALHYGADRPMPLPPGHAAVIPAGEQACSVLAEKPSEVIRILGPGAAL